MKKFLTGLLTGLILATTTFSFAAPQAIKLIVNGKELTPDVPPQIINGRTMIPARPLAEALGAKVEWDAANRSVVVSDGLELSDVPTDLPPIGETVKPPLPEPVKQEPIESDWISLRDLNDKYGVYVSVGDTVTLKNGDKIIDFKTPAGVNGPVEVNVTPQLRVKVENSRLFMSITELKNLGFI